MSLRDLKLQKFSIKLMNFAKNFTKPGRSIYSYKQPLKRPEVENFNFYLICIDIDLFNRGCWQTINITLTS